MAAQDLSRRSFLVLTGGAVLLAACGGDDDGKDGDDGRAEGDSTTSGGTAHDHTEFTDAAAAVVSSDLFVSDEPQRFAFAVLAKEGYASGDPARIAIAPPGEAPTEFVDATPRADGLPEFRGVYTIERVFDVAGTWAGRLEYQQEASDFLFVVNERPNAPVPGDDAPAAASPTPDDPLGVDPICTREPPCDLHAKSLDTLVGKGRPVVVLFGTPALCQTQYCGPVLDVLVPIAQEHATEIDTVHVEIYRDLTGAKTAPTVDAWELASEPWLFGIDADGVVTARIDGAFDAAEIRSVFATLT